MPAVRHQNQEAMVQTEPDPYIAQIYRFGLPEAPYAGFAAKRILTISGPPFSGVTM